MENLGHLYFSRRLGRPVSRARREADAKPSAGQSYETWREGASRTEVLYERIINEAEFRRQLLTEPARPGMVLVIGEPGAGKSSLLDALVAEWARSEPSWCLGARVPVIVRCRDLEAVDFVPGLPDELADRFWVKKLEPPAAAWSTPVRPYFDRESGRAWEPLWLIDGLDELPDGLLEDALCRRLAALPGQVCATCRTAIAQAEEDTWRRSVEDEPVEVLPLHPGEQRAFLAACLNGDEARAGALHERVQDNAQLRELAGSPLLLELMAKVGETVLPESRTSFYAEAVAKLWERRVKGAYRDRLRPYRDALLTEMAGRMRLKPTAGADVLDGSLATLSLTPADVEAFGEAIGASGLLRWQRENVEFLHLTFQEFFLARHFASRHLAELLNEHWADPRYEETLALRVGLAIKEGGDGHKVDGVLLAFLDRHIEAHRREPDALWHLGRSPLRFVLHLLHRAGVRPEELPTTSARIFHLLEGADLLRTAVALDRGSPAAVLERLAADPKTNVRGGVAGNATTPAAVLERLAADPEANVRWRVAGNTATPAAVLERLAADPEHDLRAGVAGNTATPAAVLERLAADPDSFVRGDVAGNAATPAAVLERLAADPEANVRGGVASNAATPAAVLERLAADPEANVRWGVAGNAATPAAVLERLAADPEANVRWGVASNAATPAAVLERLATDPNGETRWIVAWNATTPAAVLERLAADPEHDVRWGVALNTATPAALLERLAADPEHNVRGGVARNTATPAAVLERLAADPEYNVRGGLAANTATPAAALERLAADPDHDVRWGVAGNAATPAAVLERLAADPEHDVRGGVAGNAATPAAVLERLAADPDSFVRGDVAGNAATLLEDLLPGFSRRH